MRRSGWILIVLVVGLVGLTPASARPNKQWKSWFGHIATGYAPLSGDASDVGDDGWNFNGGATYWPEEWAIGLSTELGYNSFDLVQSVVDAAGATDGEVDLWSLTAGGVWSTNTEGSVDFQISAGIGGYRLEGTLTDPALFIGPICDPWLWWCYPGVVPGDVITDQVSTTKFGYNFGVGIIFELGSGSELFLEAKYHSIQTTESTDYIPIVIGFRW